MDSEESRIINQKLDALGERQSTMQADVAALNATVKAKIAQHDRTIEVLFDQKREHEKRISRIERDYVREDALKRCQDHHTVTDREIARKVETQQVGLGKVLGGAVVAGTLVAVVVAIVLRAWNS